MSIFIPTRVNSVSADQERRLEEANERATNARKQAATLQDQLQILQYVHV